MLIQEKHKSREILLCGENLTASPIFKKEATLYMLIKRFNWTVLGSYGYFQPQTSLFPTMLRDESMKASLGTYNPFKKRKQI